MGEKHVISGFSTKNPADMQKLGGLVFQKQELPVPEAEKKKD